MSNQDTHINPSNYTDVYLRNIIVGFRSTIQGFLKWKNISEEHGEYDVILPVHYSMTGNSRYIMDAFYDDIPDKRVNMNTDSIPRAVITLKTWNISGTDFSNPNIFINYQAIDDDELIEKSAQVKWVPMKLLFDLEIVVNNELDVFKTWETLMMNFHLYKYFNYTYKKLPLNAVFNFAPDVTNPIGRDYQFEKQDLIKSIYNIEINTYYPIFDQQLQLKGNSGVTWNNDLKYK